MDRHPTGLNGLLLVDKPLGVTSAAVVRVVRRAAADVKTGHAGTLDPLATGLLICCIGPATKASGKLMDLTKVYETCVDLSAFSATDDAQGPLTPVAVETPPGIAQIRQVLDRLTGMIQQTPPPYSAIKVGGRRAYQMARQGLTVSLPARPVRVDSIELIRYQWPTLDLRITCGKGTYIRSLARDLGKYLATGGYLTLLRRTAVGPYQVQTAVTMDAIPNSLSQQDLLPEPR